LTLDLELGNSTTEEAGGLSGLMLLQEAEMNKVKIIRYLIASDFINNRYNNSFVKIDKNLSILFTEANI
jgi:hypothetical protein